MVKDIILIQKRELERRLGEPYVKRDAQLKNINKDIAKVIVGPRRSGKSFFALRALSELGSFGYVNFDDERLVDTKDYDDIVNAVNSVYGNPKYLLLDEIQNLDKWELFVNRLQRQGYNLIITGSNSKLLSKELATHLTGRHSVINVFPFSFREFVRFDKKELTESETKEKLLTYLTYGGYPEPLVKNLDYKDYLSTLFSSIIYKDIVKRHRIRSAQGVEDLATYLVSNVAREFSYNTLSKVTKCKSVNTVEKYLNYLEEAFIFFRVDRFSFKVKDRAVSNKKIYCIDNGFIHAKAFKLGPDSGWLYENAAAIELKRREAEGDMQVYYWKSQHEEVDFVTKQGTKILQLIQVCYKVDNTKTKEREIRGLLKASEELKCKDLLVLTEDYEAEEDASWFGIKGKIKFLPMWKWLLGGYTF